MEDERIRELGSTRIPYSRDDLLHLYTTELTELDRSGIGLAKHKRNLLIFSVIGLFVGASGAIPTKIDALGISFGSPAQLYLLLLLGAILGYLAYQYWIVHRRHRLIDSRANYFLHQLEDGRPSRTTAEELAAAARAAGVQLNRLARDRFDAAEESLPLTFACTALVVLAGRIIAILFFSESNIPLAAQGVADIFFDGF